MFKKGQNIFNLLFEAVSEGIIVVDDCQNIVATNSSAELMFGYSKKKLINQHLNILIPKKYHTNHNAHFFKFSQRGETRKMSTEDHLYGIHTDGTIFPVEIGLYPFEIYGKNYILSLIVDITERKRQEREIIDLNIHLEQKVVARNKKLKKTVKKLKAANIALVEADQDIKNALKKEKELNELKTKFLSLVSHEFKTPLSGILTSTMLLNKYKLSEEQDKRYKHIKIITDKVHYLNNILDDFLSIEKLETGKINYTFKNFKLSKIVNQVIYNMNMLLKEGQKINYPEEIDEISLYQDEKTMELILSNLIHNAIKYSPENSVIDISINQNSKNTIFTIEDHGLGIPSKDQNRMFERYFRADNVLHTEGTGIGLNIVKSHLDNLKGTIKFKSEVNKGTIFTITIPNKAE